MTPDRTRHLVEGILSHQGWSVYRLILGPGPAIIATRDGDRPVVVQVARASEPKGGGTYPRLDRAQGADVLASVDSAGRIVFVDRLGRSQAPTLADVNITPHDGPPAAVGPLPAAEPCHPR